MANELRPENYDGDEIDVKQKSLFARLKRLFSAGSVVRNVGGKKLKRKDTSQMGYATDRNSLRDRFNRVRSTAYNAYTRDFALSYQAARIDLFRDYDTMDMDPILASALDIYADECTTYNEFGRILTIHADDDNVKDILHNLFYDILNIEFNLWSWTRNLCKYGDFYLRLYISPEYGVYQIEPVSAYNVERIENSDPINKNYVKFQIRPTDTSAIENLESFELSHFRLISDSNFLPYGKSMIEGGRRIWKQLSLMEDAMLIHRIMRAPEKRIFKMDIGNIPPQDVDSYMEKIVNKMKKVPYIDPATGDYNLRFNLQNMVEDFYLPVRGTDSGTSIDTLAGMEFTGIDDIEYLRNKLMAALKIPKAFLGYEEELSGKATLASEDVRFAKTIQRIQKIIVSELENIAVVHLYSQGYRDESLVQFKLELTNPSTIVEKEKIDLWDKKVDVAGKMVEQKLYSKTWIYKKIFNLTKDEELEIQDQIVEDNKQAWRLKSIEEEGNDPAKSFDKINPEAEGAGPGNEGPEGGAGGTTGGGAEEELAKALGGPPEGGPETGGGEETPLKEVESVVTEKHGEHAKDYVRPSQAGKKDAGDYPFGEDPLGDKENREKSKTDRKITHTFKGGSPLSLENLSKTNIIKNLETFYSNKKSIKKELISEGENKSYLDEDNLMDD